MRRRICLGQYRPSCTLLGWLAFALGLLVGLLQFLRLPVYSAELPAADQKPAATGRVAAVLLTPTTTISEPQSLTPTLYLPLLFESAYLYLPALHMTPPWFSQPQPANQAVEQSLNVNLTWADERGATSPLRYEVHLQADRADAEVAVYRTDQPHLDPPTLALATSYRWQVIGLDPAGNRFAGPSWRFTTSGPFTPADVTATVRIPAGEFLMGCDANNPATPKLCWERELPLHPVYLATYEIDKYEVTNQHYRACVEAGVCAPPAYPTSRKRGNYFSDPAYNLYPVLFVSWWNARDYCQWQGKRLPTEAEWEKAARGTIDTRPWPWGGEFPNCTRLNFTDDTLNPWTICVDDTVQVGSYPTGASPYGVMDLAGNVFEWVADIYSEQYYQESPYLNPTGPDGAKLAGAARNLFVIRGGSYRPQWFYAQVNHRHWGHHGAKPPKQDAPFYRNDQVGFRCARSVTELE